MTWLWQPLLPGAAQQQSAVNEDRTFTIAGSAAVSFVGSSLVDRSFTIAGIAATSFIGDSTGSTRPGPAGGPDDDRRPRRRDRDVQAAYWAQRQRDAIEEAERKRLEALAEAERALEEAERAKEAEARRTAVRKVFAALKVAALTDRAAADAREAEQAALDAIKVRETEAERQAYLDALDRLNAEIEAISLEVARLYVRRREEEEFLLRQWFAA